MRHAIVVGEPDHAAERRQDQQRNHDHHRKVRTLRIFVVRAAVEDAYFVGLIRFAFVIGHTRAPNLMASI